MSEWTDYQYLVDDNAVLRNKLATARETIAELVEAAEGRKAAYHTAIENARAAGFEGSYIWADAERIEVAEKKFEAALSRASRQENG